jgi:hypothetical protein
MRNPMSRLLDLASALAQEDGVDLDIMHPEIQKLENLLKGVNWRVAYQQSWPLRGTVQAMNLINDEVCMGEGKVPVIYIAVSDGVSHNERPYADRDLFEQQEPFYTDGGGEEDDDEDED